MMFKPIHFFSLSLVILLVLMVTPLASGQQMIFPGPQSAIRQGIDVFNVKLFGAKGDGVTDDKIAIQTAFDKVATLSGGSVYFPTGTYVISATVTLKGSSGSSVSASNISILGGPGVIIKQTFSGSGHQKDGITIGNPSAADGGTGTAINISNVVVDGFEFQGARIGVWVVYGQNILVQTIRADNIAVVAVGNDADDNCQNVTVRNIYRTAEHTAADGFYTVGVFSTIGFRLENIQSPFRIFGHAITIKTSQYGTVDGVFIDQVDNVNAGIELIDGTQWISVQNFMIRRCSNALAIFDPVAGTRAKYASFGPGVILGCTKAVLASGTSTTFTGITTQGNTNSIDISSADGGGNLYVGNNFTEAIIDPLTRFAMNNWWGNNGAMDQIVTATNTTLTAAGNVKLAATSAVPSTWLVQGGSNINEIQIIGGTNDTAFVNHAATLYLVKVFDNGGVTLETSGGADPTGGTKGPGTLNFAGAMFANGTQFIDSSARLSNIPGVSSTGTVAKNLRGSCTFAAATTCAVSFGTAETDATYFVGLGCNNNKTFWVTTKATTGFTVNASASSSDVCDWHLIR